LGHRSPKRCGSPWKWRHWRGSITAAWIGKPRLLPKEEIENVRARMAGYGHAEK
jgi:hypothetical protein